MATDISDCERETPADWSEWDQRISAEIWEAIALSMNIEPKDLPVDWRPIVGGRFDDCSTEFNRRLRIALDHIANGKLRYTPAFGVMVRGKVTLSDFADWAPLDWCLPGPFLRKKTPALAAPASRTRPKDADLDRWMAANVRRGDKREASIAKCCTDTGATFRAAAAAWERLPPEKRRHRGQHGPVIKSDT